MNSERDHEAACYLSRREAHGVFAVFGAARHPVAREEAVVEPGEEEHRAEEGEELPGSFDGPAGSLEPWNLVPSDTNQAAVRAD